MILLSVATPTTTDELVASLRALLAQALTVSPSAVRATGGFPGIQNLTIDLTGATPLDRPAVQWLDAAAGPVVGQFTVDALSITGHPFGDGQRAADVDVTARACRAEFVDAGGGRTALRTAGASDGKLRASVTKAAVEAVVRTEGNKQAGAHGVELKEVHVDWQADGPRRLSLQASVKAKKGFLPAATVRLRGVVEIDGALTARVSGLSVDGDGMVGSVAAGFIRPKLTQVDGKSFSLLKLPLDGLKITDVRWVAAPAALSVEADFAG